MHENDIGVIKSFQNTEWSNLLSVVEIPSDITGKRKCFIEFDNMRGSQ